MNDLQDFRPMLEVPDAEDIDLHIRNCNCDMVTEHLGELVPLLNFVGFRVDKISPEKTVLSVPLLETAMNQNGTHQAAVFYLIADYTLGIGMFAVLPGCYTVGVHDRCRALPVQFWLKSGRVEHHAPGTGAIRSEVEIPPETAACMREQLMTTGRCGLKHPVHIYQGDRLVAVAEHEMLLFADVPRPGETISMTQAQRLKTSALMIAGLRDDPVSAALAGEQGAAIARRMSRASPQLPTLVAARTRHVRDYLKGAGREHTQVLVLGSGLDSKPVDFARPEQKWFLCDLPDMLGDRQQRLAAQGIESPNTVAVAVDLRWPGWQDEVLRAGFDPSQSTVVILEGVSMYIERGGLQQSLDIIRGLCGHPGSRLWLDHVTEDLFAIDAPEVSSFLSSMARFGEPFITGFTDAAAFARRADGPAAWRVMERRSASEVLGHGDAIHDNYLFTMMGPDETGTTQSR